MIVLDSAALSQPGVAPVYTAPNTTTAAVVLLLYSTWCGATTATNTNTCSCLFCNLLLQQPTTFAWRRTTAPAAVDAVAVVTAGVEPLEV